MTHRGHHGNGPVLPVFRNAEPPKPEPFPIGALVYLANLRYGHPGVVLGSKRGKIIVRWPMPLNFTGRHSAAALILAALPDEAAGVSEDEEATKEENDDGE